MVQFKKSERDCGTRQRGTHPAGAECPSPDEGSVFSFRGYGWGGAGGGGPVCPRETFLRATSRFILALILSPQKRSG